MDKVEASNEVTVERFSESLNVKRGSVESWLEPWAVNALREFFQAERDHELGRWRWPENPDYVVYPLQRIGLDVVKVVHEFDGYQVSFKSRTEAEHFPGSIPGHAAVAYFDAHNVRKLWYDAKPGEVWVVTEGDISETYAYLVDDGQFYDSARDYALDFTDPAITAARRIWPESD